MSLITKGFYIFIWISVTQEEYYVSETSSGESDESCTFAKPPLTFAQKKVTAQLDHFNVEMGKLWVGYFRKKSGFDFVGCVAETDITNTVAPTESSKDPGYCFTICKHRGTNGIIGIFNTTCFCLNEDGIRNINLTRPHCTLTCTSGKGLACGGVLGTESFVSLYRLNYNVTDEVNQADGESCLDLDPVNHIFMPINCLKYLSVLCSDDQNVFKLTQFKPWIDATLLCLSKNSLPANYSTSIKAKVNSTSTVWTGVMRSLVIYEFDAEVPSHSDIEYGYLTKSGSAYELKFEEKDKRKPYLCVKEASTTKTTNTISTSLNVNVTIKISSTVLSKSQTTSSSVNVSRTTITSHADSSMQDSSVTVPVVVSFSCVLIIAISIAALLVLRRRGKIPDICGNTNSNKSSTAQTKYESSVKKTTEGNQYMEVDNMISNSKNDRNIDVETDNTNYAHTYFVLEKVEKQPDIENASGIYAKEMEGSYVYNTLEQDVDKKIKKSKAIDNTYDTTKTVAEKLKSKLGEDSDALGDTDENLYNHTNSVPMKNNNTENVYNVTGDIENEYGDTDTNHGNKTFVDDDTYNHI